MAATSLTTIPAHVVSVADYLPLAHERTDPKIWAYLAGGAADELTVRENKDAYLRWQILPRVLRDFTDANTATDCFGTTLKHPIFVAPTAFHRLFHPQGELATLHGAAALEAGMVVSTSATTLLEEIAENEHATAPLWFQLYLQPDRDFTQHLIQRAEASGYQALVVTVDAPFSGVRNREQRAAFSLPSGIEPVNLRGRKASPPPQTVFGSALLRESPTWADIEWLCSVTQLPILLKGVMHPADARIAIGAGVDGLILSNHGGRTLDTLPATLDALPAVVSEVSGEIPIWLDGGIQRGTDIFKALALGATGVMVGRPILHGLTAAGALGVAHILKILRTELEVTMVLAGCPTLACITREHLRRHDAH